MTYYVNSLTVARNHDKNRLGFCCWARRSIPNKHATNSRVLSILKFAISVFHFHTYT